MHAILLRRAANRSNAFALHNMAGRSESEVLRIASEYARLGASRPLINDAIKPENFAAILLTV